MMRWLRIARVACAAWVLILPRALAQQARPADAGAEAQAAVKAAYLSGKHDDYSRAASLLAAYLRDHPADAEARKTLAFTWLDKLHEPRKALPLLEQIVAAGPDDPHWQPLLGRALDETGDHRGAAEHFAKAAQLDPQDAWTRYELGQALAKQGKHGEAAAAFRAAMALDGKSPYVREALAWELATLRDTPGALDVLRPVAGDPAAAKLIDYLSHPAAPRPSPLDRAVAAAYRSNQPADYRRAAAMLEAALRAHPADLARRKTLAFTYLVKLRDPRAALPHLLRVAAALPRDAGWKAYLGQARETTGDLAGAASAYRAAAALAPRDAWVRCELGGVLEKQRRYAEAEAAYREALDADPGNAPARAALGHLLLDRGRWGQARAFSAGAVQAHPGEAQATALLGDLDRLDFHYAQARREYAAALGEPGGGTAAASGLQAIALDERMRYKLDYYLFQDTSHFWQSGIFGYLTPLIRGPLEISLFTNELFFKRTTHTVTVGGIVYGTPPSGTLNRTEYGTDAEWRANHWLQLVGSLHGFQTPGQDFKTGGGGAVYVTPARAWNFFGSYQTNQPVNDSYFTAQQGLTQNVAAGGINVIPLKGVTASLTGDTADYSDGNVRRDALASAAWTLWARAGVTVKYEWQWQDYAHHTSNYPSAQHYALLRPVIEVSPQLTHWLRLDVRDELDYVADDHGWGNGLTAGFHCTLGNSLELGAAYLNYQLPGTQTNYAGSGFKVELDGRF